MRYFLAIWLFVIVATVSILGFRGGKSSNPPVYVFPDMDRQAKYTPQGGNTFYSDGRDARPPVPGTVGRGQGWEIKEVFSGDYRDSVSANPSLYSGKTAGGDFYKGFPVPVTHEFIAIGRQKYAIYCLVCHGETGDGRGVLASDGSELAMTAGYFGNIATLIDERMRAMPEGQIFDVITNGFNTMGAYGYAILPEDRWAVVAYVRALQLAAHASAEDVPEQFKSRLGL